MVVIRCRFLSLAVAAAATPFALQFARSQIEAPSTSPGSPLLSFPEYNGKPPVLQSWALVDSGACQPLFAALTPASMVVIDRGWIVVAWGALRDGSN